jgi:hypothetical protein
VACVDHSSEWTAAKIAVMASGSWMAAMTRILPPQRGHRRAKRANRSPHPVAKRRAQFWDRGAAAQGLRWPSSAPQRELPAHLCLPRSSWTRATTGCIAIQVVPELLAP